MLLARSRGRPSRLHDRRLSGDVDGLKERGAVLFVGRGFLVGGAIGEEWAFVPEVCEELACLSDASFMRGNGTPYSFQALLFVHLVVCAGRALAEGSSCAELIQ
jgi:hypothetical protein